MALAVAALLTLPYPLTWLLQAPLRSRARAAGEPLPSYSLFSFTTDLDQAFYAARVRGAAQHVLPFSPYVAEDRTPRLLMTDGAGFVVLGLIQRFTHDIELTWILARALLGFGWTMLLLGLLEEATGNLPAAKLCAAGITLFGDAAHAAVRWNQFPFSGWRESLENMLLFVRANNLYFGPTRLLSPCFTFFALLVAGALAVRTARGTGRWVWAGLAAGLLAYVHTDVWSVGLAGLGGLSAWASLRRENRARHLWKAFLMALLLSAPWMLVITRLDADFLLRIGARGTRVPDPRALMFLAACGGAWQLSFRCRPAGRPTCLWLGGALLGVAISLNTQCATGLSVQPFHWMLVGAFLLAVLASLAIGLFPNRERLLSWVLWGLFIAALCRGAAYARAHVGSHLMWGQTKEALEWLDRNAAGSVVSTVSPEANLVIPVYTRARTLAACDSPVAADLTASENAARLVHAAALLDVDERGFLEGTLPESPRTYDDTPYGPGEEYHAIVGAEKVFFPYVFFSEYPREGLKYVFHDAFGSPRKFRADWVWVGPFERELMGRNPAGLGKPAFQNAWISIYKQ